MPESWVLLLSLSLSQALALTLTLTSLSLPLVPRMSALVFFKRLWKPGSNRKKTKLKILLNTKA